MAARKKQAGTVEPLAPLLLSDDICQRYHVDPKTLYLRIKNGLAPPPSFTANRIRYWDPADVRAFEQGLKDLAS